jgi:hypothetical protein
MTRWARGAVPKAARSPRAGAAVALLLVAAVVVALTTSTGPTSAGSTPSGAGKASGAATVQRRDLVQTDTESGTLSYSGPQTVYDRLGGTITWLPQIGQLIRPGQALYDIDNQPIILMNGSTPAYRTLSAATASGPDVLELNRNLVALGFNADAVTINDLWQPATTVGVELLQGSLGYAETGSLSLGQVVFLPGDQLVSAVDATLGSAGGAGGTPAAGTSGASGIVATARPELVGLVTGPAPPNQARHASNHSRALQTLSALAALVKVETAQLRAETAQLKAAQKMSSAAKSGGSPSSGGTSSASGSSSAGASAILQTTSTRLVVTVQLAASTQSEAKLGEHVTVEMPAGNTVDGRITGVSPVAQSSSASGGGGGGSGSGGGAGGGGGASSPSSTIPVTITLAGQHTGVGLDQAAVSVNFAQRRARHVLSVPVTALLATSGGQYSVQEAAAPHRLIPVTTGLFAAGYVQISGPGIDPGLLVTDSQG